LPASWGTLAQKAGRPYFWVAKELARLTMKRTGAFAPRGAIS
jgi:hypothetical protein